jgi:hypothetical protein
METPEAALVRGIKQDLGQQQAAEKLTLEKRQAIGEKLLHLKMIVGHGRWLGLLKEIGLPQQTAWRRMRDFREKDQITHVSDLEEQVARSSRVAAADPEEQNGAGKGDTGSSDTEQAAAGEHQQTTASLADGDQPPTTAAGGPAASPKSDQEKDQQSQRPQHQVDQERDEGDVFVEVVTGICKDLDKIIARMKDLGHDRHSHSIHLDSAVSQAKAARQTLWLGRPAHPCPYCEAKGAGDCKACHGTRRVKKALFESGRDAAEATR